MISTAADREAIIRARQVDSLADLDVILEPSAPPFDLRVAGDVRIMLESVLVAALTDGGRSFTSEIGRRLAGDLGKWAARRRRELGRARRGR